MVTGKTQLAAAAVVVAFAGSALAVPTSEFIFARNPKAGDLLSKAGKHLGGEYLQNKGMDMGNNLMDHLKPKPAPIPQQYHDAINRMNGPHPQPIVQGVINAHLRGGKKDDKKKRSVNDEFDELYARKRGYKVLSDSEYRPSQGGSQHKRDLDGAIRIMVREFGDDAVYELVVRSGRGGKVAADLLKDRVHDAITTAATDKLKEKYGPKPQPLPPAYQAAIAKMTGPSDPSIVNAAIHPKPKPKSGDKKKRDLVEEIYQIFARELELDDLE